MGHDANPKTDERALLRSAIAGVLTVVRSRNVQLEDAHYTQNRLESEVATLETKIANLKRSAKAERTELVKKNEVPARELEKMRRRLEARFTPS